MALPPVANSAAAAAGTAAANNITNKTGTTPTSSDGVDAAIGQAEAAAQVRRMESVKFSNAMQQIAQDTEHVRKGLEQSGKGIFAETRTG